jgi:hypothetical protein
VITETRAWRPEMVAETAANRKRAPSFPSRLLLIAADEMSGA